MAYVLRLTSHNGKYRAGAYVAPPGRHGAYVYALQQARLFATREQAEAARCPGNERIEEVHRG